MLGYVRYTVDMVHIVDLNSFEMPSPKGLKPLGRDGQVVVLDAQVHLLHGLCRLPSLQGQRPP